jgi:ParB-like chromosome segregation protein Spo0J
VPLEVVAPVRLSGVLVSNAEVLSPDVEVAWVTVSSLELSSSHREAGLCPDHVAQLVAARGSWPPIVVTPAGTVVDGAHRVAAARRLGLRRIEAVIFDGGPEDAFVEFVRRNVVHGLLLTLRERKHAAVRILRVHASWSDRRVAELCGLSSKTVGRLRADAGVLSGDAEGSPVLRIGRDDRRRPVERGSVRSRVIEALRARPAASLRALAAEAGVSPETVRLVRLNLAQLAPSAEEPAADPAPEPAPPRWHADAALASCDKAEDLLSWFDQTTVCDSDVDRTSRVPLSRVYEMADEARRRANLWQQFARVLEARATRAT